MSGRLWRLFSRKALAWDLFVLAVLARVVSWITNMVSATVSGAALAGEVTYESPEALRVHLALLGGAGLGLLASLAVQDLGYCRFSWFLPGLGRTLRRELAQLAAGVTLVAGVGYALVDPALPPGAAGALALAGFGLGLALWDARVGRVTGYVAALALAALLLAARPLHAWLAASVLAPWLLALPLAAASIARGTSTRALRARASVRPSELGTAFREPALVPAYQGARLTSTRTWRGGLLRGVAAWTRALHYEDAGWARGGWAPRTALVCAVVALATSLLLFAMGLQRGGTLENGLAWVTLGILDPRATVEGLVGRPPRFVAANGFATALLLVVIGTRQDLRRGVLYPLSRAERAEVVWRAGLRRLALGVGSACATYAAVALVCARLGAVSLELRRVPDLALTALACAALLPGLQWARLRWLDCRSRRFGPTGFALSIALCGALYAAGTALLLAALQSARAPGASLAAAGAALAALLVAQALYRAFVRRWMARAALT